MPKIQVIIWDITKEGKSWLKEHTQEDKLDIIAEVSEDGTGILIEKVMEMEGWDYLFIFETSCRDLVDNILKICNIQKEKVIFVLDTESLLQHYDVAYYLFDAYIQRQLDYARQRSRNEFVTCTVGGYLIWGNLQMLKLCIICLVKVNHGHMKNSSAFLTFL